MRADFAIYHNVLFPPTKLDDFLIVILYIETFIIFLLTVFLQSIDYLSTLLSHLASFLVVGFDISLQDLQIRLPEVPYVFLMVPSNIVTNNSYSRVHFQKNFPKLLLFHRFQSFIRRFQRISLIQMGMKLTFRI